MSAFSGPTHQGLVGDTTDGTKKKSKPKTIPKDDVADVTTTESDVGGIENRKRIDEGMEALVMMASHDHVVTDVHDKSHNDIINAVRKELIAYVAVNGDAELAEMYIDDGMEDLAKVKETLGAVIKKIAQITSILLSTAKDGLKKVSDRLNRLAIRNNMLRRKVENSGDKLSQSNEIPLPETHPYITIKGRPPKTANDVSHAVMSMKDFFVCVHNTNAAFHSAFSQAIDNGTRDESIYSISQYLNLLANRVGAKPSNSGNFVYDGIPAGYGMVINVGKSFSDCDVGILRVQPQEVKAPMTQRADKASLLRILDNNEQFLKNINEVYGRISSRLDGEFRKNVKAAETKLRGSDEYDGRAMASTVDWFGDNQNKIFTKSMQMGCSVIAAAMDYIHNNLVKAGVGTEDLDGIDEGYDEIDMESSVEEPGIDETRIGLAIAEVRARTLSVIPGDLMSVDRTMERLLTHTSSGTPLVLSNSLDVFNTLWNVEKHSEDDYLVEVSDQLLSLHDGLARLINTKRDTLSYRQLKEGICGGNPSAIDLLCSCGSDRLDYYRFDLRISNQAIKPCEEVYGLIKTHLSMLTDSFNNEDIMLSSLVERLTGVDGALWSKPIYMTGKYLIDRTSRCYGDVVLPQHCLVVSEISKPSEIIAQDVPVDVDFKYNIERCIKLYNQFGVLHAEYTDLYTQINNVFKIIVSSLLTTQDRSWVSGAFTYLSILIGTVRWLTRLHNDTMDYLLSLSRQMLFRLNELSDQK